MARKSLNATGCSVVAIVGPTASGKSEVAQLVAQRLDGEIVSADSMQVYRYLDIGTGKVLPHERRVPHHLIDVTDISQPYSAALYQITARAAIDDICLRGLLPIVCGGTGLYVRAALDDMEFPPGQQVNNALRAELEALADSKGADALIERLRSLDPAAVDLIHPNNTRRLIRAIEMAHEGRCYSQQASGFRAYRPHYPTRYFGLRVDRAVLYGRIDRRVQQMVNDGWLEEVDALVARGLQDSLTALQAIGYRELLQVRSGELSLQEAIASIQTATRRYAKRQMTWFQGDPRVEWIEATDGDSARIASEIVALL